MGDRVSISFKNGKDESIVLFSHWGGREFPRLAVQYVRELKQDIKRGYVSSAMPLGRLEPSTVMVDFVRFLVTSGIESEKSGRIESDFYFGKDKDDGDNSDNGHYTIELNVVGRGGAPKPQATATTYSSFDADEGGR